jgi:hypothetical protein
MLLLDGFFRSEKLGRFDLVSKRVLLDRTRVARDLGWASSVVADLVVQVVSHESRLV